MTKMIADMLYGLRCCMLGGFLLCASSGWAQRTPTAVLTIDPKKATDTVSWTRAREIAQGTTLDQFRKLFNTLHGKTHDVLLDNTPSHAAVGYDSLSHTYWTKSSHPPQVTAGTEVMGWLPYWSAQTYARPYSGFTTLSFVAYDIHEQDGGYKDYDAIAAWKQSPVIDSALAHGQRVLLSLTCYDRSSVAILLENDKVWSALGDSVRRLLQLRHAHGIDLDVTGVAAEHSKRFVEFVNALRARLGDTTFISLALPYRSIATGYDIKELKPLVNLFVLQGYDHDNPQCLGRPLPLAPLAASRTDCPASLQQALGWLLQQGLPPSSIVLSLPLYGARWKKQGSAWQFKEYLPFDDIKSTYASNRERLSDDDSGSSFLRLSADEIIWYESGVSLDRKWSWVVRNGLRGGGVWGLGFDGGQADVWQNLTNHFGPKPWEITTPLGYREGSLYMFSAALQKYRKPIGLGVLIIVVFFLAGLLLSLLDWRVRMAFFQNNTYRALYGGALVLATLFGTYLMNTSGNEQEKGSWASFLYGLLVGATIIYVTTLIYLNYRKKLH